VYLVAPLSCPLYPAVFPYHPSLPLCVLYIFPFPSPLVLQCTTRSNHSKTGKSRKNSLPKGKWGVIKINTKNIRDMKWSIHHYTTHHPIFSLSSTLVVIPSGIRLTS
jgi:hypothetical protein